MPQKKQEDNAYRLFLDYLQLENLNLSTILSQPKQLDTALSNFFACLRKADGDKMKVNSFYSIKYALARKMSNCHNVKITNSDLFPDCNSISRAVVKDLKKAVMGTPSTMKKFLSKTSDI